MSIILEKGNEHENDIDFVRYVGMFQVDMKVSVPRWEWELWGMPERVELSLRPVY